MLNQKLMNLRNYVVFFTIALLAACSGNPAIKPAAKAPPATASKPAPGGYYLDDGPGENAPANIDSIPSATPKTEQLYARANKPYSALGQQYTPMTSYVPYKKQGIASWYGKRYHGKNTSTGEVYDMYAMSAAHTVLPIPSYAKVTNPANGRSVIVRINDRGPFKHDRLIDLSYAAAFQLRLIKQGSGLVEVETIDTSPEALRKTSANKPVQIASLPENTSSDNSTTVAQTMPTESAPMPAPASGVTPSTTINSTTTQYYVQAGAFKSEANGKLLQKKIQGLALIENVDVANVYNNGLFRVKLGPYTSKTEADISAANIRRQLNTAAHVTNQ